MNEGKRKKEKERKNEASSLDVYSCSVAKHNVKISINIDPELKLKPETWSTITSRL